MQVPRILCIEDEPDLREDLVVELVEAGFAVSGVADVEAGLEVLTEARFDLVISDIQTPRMNAMQLLEAFVGCARRPTFLILTAYTDRAMHDTVFGLGADAIIVKPVDYAELIALVEYKLGRAAEEAGL